MGGNRLLKYIAKTIVLQSRYLPKRFAATNHKTLSFHHETGEPLLLLRERPPCSPDDRETYEYPKTFYFTALSSPGFAPKSSVQLPFPEFPPEYPYLKEIVGHSNGVFCLSTGYKMDEYVLWNPLTNEHKFLPPSPVPRPPGAEHSVKCSCFAALSRNSTLDYKVLQLVESVYERYGWEEHTVYQYDLYSLKSNSWKEITHSWMYRPPDDCKLVSLRGVSYWLKLGDPSIRAFDFEAEEFRSLPLPEARNGPNYTGILMDYDGSLSVVVVCESLSCFDYQNLFEIEIPWYAEECYVTERSYEVWVLTDDSSTWAKAAEFSVAGRPLRFWKKDALLLRGRDGELLLFDLATGEVKDVGGDDCRRSEIFAYVPSAAPLTYSDA